MPKNKITFIYNAFWVYVCDYIGRSFVYVTETSNHVTRSSENLKKKKTKAELVAARNANDASTTSLNFLPQFWFPFPIVKLRKEKEVRQPFRHGLIRHAHLLRSEWTEFNVWGSETDSRKFKDLFLFLLFPFTNYDSVVHPPLYDDTMSKLTSPLYDWCQSRTSKGVQIRECPFNVQPRPFIFSS